MWCLKTRFFMTVPYSRLQPSYYRDIEPRSPSSVEEKEAADESLKVYCKPVELYNILQIRAIKKPLFLQRCLNYKTQEKNKSRVQISISTNGACDYGVQTESLFSLYILLARPVFTPNGKTLCSSSYRFKRACKLTVSNGAPAKFLLPEIKKLSAEMKSGSLVMLLVSCADTSNPNNMFSSSSEGYCLLGKIPINFLHFSWEKSPNSSLEGKIQVMSTVSMQACYMKLRCSDQEKCVSFQFPPNSEAVVCITLTLMLCNMKVSNLLNDSVPIDHDAILWVSKSTLQQVPVIITAEELGARYKLAYEKSISTDSPPCDIRQKMGNVVFDYKYYNNMLQKTEVREDFSCAFCLVKCTSFKGLKWHLNSSHNLFHYEFWANGDYQVVVVSPKTNACNSEILGNMVDPREQPFLLCHKPLRRRNGNQNANHVGPLALASNMPKTLIDSKGASDQHVECEVSFKRSNPRS